MTSVFADTSYFIALLTEGDELHDIADEYARRIVCPILTTAWIVTELVDAFSKQPYRQLVIRFVESLRSDTQFKIVEPSQALLDDGLDFFSRRPDKDWSLTDCISFVVMEREGLTEALTGDRHFVQAGFNALLAG